MHAILLAALYKAVWLAWPLGDSVRAEVCLLALFLGGNNFLAKEGKREGRHCCCISESSLKHLETLLMYMSMLYTDEISIC